MKAKSDEIAVDNFWANTLAHYFTQEKFYGIEREQSPLEGVHKRVNITIRYIKDSKKPKRVVLIENKKKGYENQESKWVEAKTQLTKYLKLARADQFDRADNQITLYGIVGIGQYVRFYSFSPGEQEMDAFPSSAIDVYDIRKDDDKVHAILNKIVKDTFK